MHLIPDSTMRDGMHHHQNECEERCIDFYSLMSTPVILTFMSPGGADEVATDRRPIHHLHFGV
jgi:hypothetical protein